MKSKKKWIELAGSIAFFSIGVWFIVGFPSLRRDEDPPKPIEELRESIDFEEMEGPRSSQWPRVRSEFVRLHPICEACGGIEDLNVHHVEPFHLKPELELDLKNLITLCREHHFRIGHDPDGPWKPARPNWSASNPEVRKHCDLVRSGRSY